MSEEGSSAEEILDFLTPSTRKDVRLVAVKHIAGISLSSESFGVIRGFGKELILRLINLLSECERGSTEEKLLLASLINLSSVAELREIMLRETSCLDRLLSLAKPDSDLRHDAVKILSNLTVTSSQCSEVASKIDLRSFVADSVKALNNASEEKESYGLYSGYVLRNLSQLREVRALLGSAENGPPLISQLYALLRLLPSSRKKRVAVDLIRNCCFDTELHSSLIQSPDFAVALAFPLAGPEEFKESEMDELPLDLQYLDDEKERESEPELRRKLLEALYQLCSTSKGRVYLRGLGIYYILRELHKWERDEACLQLCGNVIGVLIRTEDEMLYDNLREEISEEDLASIKVPS